MENRSTATEKSPQIQEAQGTPISQEAIALGPVLLHTHSYSVSYTTCMYVVYTYIHTHVFRHVLTHVGILLVHYIQAQVSTRPGKFYREVTGFGDSGVAAY